MNSRVIYQPYKTNADEWQVVEDGIRESVDGKVICPVVIGCRIEKDANNEEIGKDMVTEDVYQDVLAGIFTKRGYKVRVRLGREPGLVVTYNNELICHNDKTKYYLDKLIEIFNKTDQNAAIDMLIAGVLNENIEEKYTPACQEFIDNVNAQCGLLCSTEFVIMALKKYFCADRKTYDPGVQYADYATLMHKAGEVLKGRMEGFFDEVQEESLLDELLYRFLYGSLVEKE